MAVHVIDFNLQLELFYCHCSFIYTFHNLTAHCNHLESAVSTLYVNEIPSTIILRQNVQRVRGFVLCVCCARNNSSYCTVRCISYITILL